jgi:hypothetical protein
MTSRVGGNPILHEHSKADACGLQRTWVPAFAGTTVLALHCGATFFKIFLILFTVGFIYVQQSLAEDAATPVNIAASARS